MFKEKRYLQRKKAWNLNPSLFSCAEGRGLLLHVEAEADAVVVLGELADLLDGAVAAHGCQELDDGEQLLGLEEQRDAAVLAFGIAVDAEQHALERDLGGLLVQGPRAAERLAGDGGLEGLVFVEDDRGVLAADAYLLVVGRELLLNLGGCHLAAGLGQQVLAGEGAARAAVLPCADESLSGDLVESDDAGEGVGQCAAAADGLEQCACSARCCHDACREEQGSGYC